MMNANNRTLCCVALILVGLALIAEGARGPMRTYSKRNEPFGTFSNNQTTVLYLYQSHTNAFWQINADDAATPMGEIGFIAMEWVDYTDYDFVTVYKVEVNSSYNVYVPCDQGESCTDRAYKNPKLLGASPLGNVAMLDNQTNLVNYYPWTWYSIPSGGQCAAGQPMGYEHCGFLPPCAVKSVRRSCLHSKPGWQNGVDSDNVFPLFPLFEAAFLFNDTADGGCPDETGTNFQRCENADEHLAQIFAPRQSKPDYLPKDSKPKIRPNSMKVQESAANPLITLNHQTSAICEITASEGKGTCTDLYQLDIDLSNYEDEALASGDSGNVFFHLIGKKDASACAPNLILGYNVAQNAIVYNHTTSYEFTWFGLDMEDNMIVGLTNKVVDDYYGSYSIQVVNIDLSSSTTTNLSPFGVYNNTYAITQASFDTADNVIRFSGNGCYMNMVSILSYQVNTANELAFPIMEMNIEVNSLAYNSLLDAHFAYGSFYNSYGFTQLNVELMQGEGPFYTASSEYDVVGNTMDNLNGYWSICSSNSGTDGHTFVTVDLTTGKLRQDFTIPTGCTHAVFAN